MDQWIRSRPWIILLAFLAIVIFSRVTEQGGHVLGVLQYLLLLACPLMHFLQGRHRDEHGGHGR